MKKWVSGENTVRKIHKILNHKSKEQMYYAYRNAGKLTNEVKKVIDNVVEKCKIYKKNTCSRSRPSIKYQEQQTSTQWLLGTRR